MIHKCILITIQSFFQQKSKQTNHVFSAISIEFNLKRNISIYYKCLGQSKIFSTYRTNFDFILLFMMII